MLQNQLDKLEAVSGGAALALTRLEGDLLHYKVLAKALVSRRLTSNGGRTKSVKHTFRERELTEGTPFFLKLQQEHFNKLAISFTEQTSKEKFLRAIDEDIPINITLDSNQKLGMKDSFELFGVLGLECERW